MSLFHFSENVKPDCLNKKKETALYIACVEGEADIAAALVNAGDILIPLPLFC